MSKETKQGWNKCKTTKMVFPLADCFYQKCFYEKDEKICANIIEYILKQKLWILQIQIPKEISITKMTINAECFSYEKLDFEKMGRDAKKIIKCLMNKT